MIFDEDPALIIKLTVDNFNIKPDVGAVYRIHDSLDDLHQARAYRISEAESALKKLSRKHHLLESQHAETLSTHSSTQHASQIVVLDTQKFRIAKSASDLEIESERLEADLEALRSRLQELEMQGVEGDETSQGKREGEDPTVLKLKVYRSLGIEAEADERGDYGRAVVRNNVRGDVHVVNIDSKFSRFFYANYFWGTI